MQTGVEPSAATWFTRAVQSYVERHQGCPWCGQSHCVFRSRRPDREQYSCSACDFFACHVLVDDRYFAAPGQSSERAAS